MRTFNRDQKPSGRKRTGSAGSRFKNRPPARSSERFEQRGPKRPESGEATRIMHEATCSSCRKKCQIPFKPVASKPVYCNDCFRKDSPARISNDSAQIRDEFEQLHTKLDKIMKALKIQ